MDWLKDLLQGMMEDEKIETVVENFKKEFPKHAVPKKEFNEKLEELKTAKAQIEDNKVLIEDMTKKAETVEEYEKNLTEYKTKFEQLEKESQIKIDSIKKKTGMQLKLNDYFVEDAVPLLIDKLDMESIILGQDGDILEADKHIEKLKSQFPKLAKEAITQSEETKPKETQTEPTEGMSDDEFYKAKGVKPLW